MPPTNTLTSSVDAAALCKMDKARRFAPGRGEFRARRSASGVARGSTCWKEMGERSFVVRERRGDGFWVVMLKRRALRRGSRVGRTEVVFASA